MGPSTGHLNVVSTLSTVEPEMLSCVAEIVVDCPAVAPVARPAALIVAAAVLDEAHVAEVVRSCVEPSLNLPVPVNCWAWPGATEGSTGVTAIETSVAAVTLRPAEPEMLPCFAEIVADWPAVTPFARPAESTVATAFDEDHVTELVTFCVVPFEKVPVAVN
jgi:hypothetical protein